MRSALNIRIDVSNPARYDLTGRYFFGDNVSTDWLGDHAVLKAMEQMSVAARQQAFEQDATNGLPPSTLDWQVGGDHYKRMGIQPWQVIDACKLDFYVGTAVAYLMRWEAKGGLQDIEKAIHTLEHFVERERAKGRK